MTEAAISELALRRKPIQKRSVATFEKVLDTAAALIEERGLGGFNTNLLSEHSGVSIRAIYRYAPNKHALVAELARRMTSKWRDELARAGGAKGSAKDWPEVWCDYLDRFVRAVRRTTGATAVLQAMRSDPELRAIDDETNAEYARDVAKSLLLLEPALGNREAQTIADLLMKTTVAVVDVVVIEKPARAKRLMDELKAMHVVYLRERLSPELLPREERRG